jgi:hypothetical protein
MKTNFKSTAIGFALGLTVAGGSAQAAVQAAQHEHSPASAQKPSADATGMEGMKDMDAMMADPAMRQKMMEHMAQCREMMSMMMDHMEHKGKMGSAEPAPHKH